MPERHLAARYMKRIVSIWSMREIFPRVKRHCTTLSRSMLATTLKITRFHYTSARLSQGPRKNFGVKFGVGRLAKSINPHPFFLFF